MNILMDEEVNNNIAIVESFVNYCKNNEPDKDFLGKIANKIRNFYSNFSNGDDTEDIDSLYNEIETKYNFSDIEFIDPSDDSDNENLSKIANESPSDNEKESDNEDNIEKVISESARKRLDNFLNENFDSDKIYLYKKKSKVIESLNTFIDQSTMY